MKQNSIITTLNCLIKKNIRLVCIDFDDTLLSINTFGKWDIDPLELTDYIRPVFIKFINNCLKKNIHVAIVSYSSQNDVIYKCLYYFLKDNINKIYIMTSNKLNQCDKKYCKKIKKNIIMKRKNPMILSVCTEIYFKYKEQLHPNQVILIDNDWNNIKMAKQGGFNTYHFNNNSDNTFFNDLISNMDHFLNKTSYTFIFADACKLLMVCCLLLFLFFKNKPKLGTRLVTYKVK